MTAKDAALHGVVLLEAANVDDILPVRALRRTVRRFAIRYCLI
jgi:hypothetical protein